jgi:Fe2+ or Zn2+ uptake regulation protein
MSGCRERLRELFKARGLRLTPQRLLVLEVLEESDKHLDAEAVHEMVRMRDQDISLATVYRTLMLFKEMGLVEEHRLGEGHSHYEAVGGGPHYHFTCLSCGRVIEFDLPSLVTVERDLERRLDATIVEAHLHMMGYCDRCRNGRVGEGDRVHEASKA